MTASLGETLAEERRALGLLQKEVAAALGYSKGHLSDIEQGRRKFPVDRLGRLPRSLRIALGRRIIADFESKIAHVEKVIAEEGAEA